MSFILDALRKSETERQQQSTPGLADSRYIAPKKTRGIWTPLLLGVLAVNALLLAFVLLKKAPDNTSRQTAATSTTVRSLAIPPIREVREVRPLADEIPAKSAPVGTPTSSPERPVTQAPGAAGPNASAVTPAAVPAAAQASAVISAESALEMYPSLQQLTVAGVLSLPPLNIDLHVYSAKPAERFVFINMAKYTEGDRLSEGPTIEKITENGAVLNHLGNRFILERE